MWTTTWLQAVCVVSSNGWLLPVAMRVAPCDADEPHFGVRRATSIVLSILAIVWRFSSIWHAPFIACVSGGVFVALVCLLDESRASLSSRAFRLAVVALITSAVGDALPLLLDDSSSSRPCTAVDDGRVALAQWAIVIAFLLETACVTRPRVRRYIECTLHVQLLAQSVHMTLTAVMTQLAWTTLICNVNGMARTHGWSYAMLTALAEFRHVIHMVLVVLFTFHLATLFGRQRGVCARVASLLPRAAMSYASLTFGSAVASDRVHVVGLVMCAAAVATSVLAIVYDKRQVSSQDTELLL